MKYDESASALTEEDIDDLHEEYSEYLIEEAPSDWHRIRYRVYSTIDHHAYLATAITAGGSEIPILASIELLELFHTLRTSMFEPGIGTWLSAVYDFDRDGGRAFTFDYGSKPPHEMELSPEDYARDLEFFPRDTDQIPSWLIEELESTHRGPGWYRSPNEYNIRREPTPVDFTIRIVDDNTVHNPESLQVFKSTEHHIAPAQPYNTAQATVPWNAHPYRDNATLKKIGEHLQEGVPNEWQSLTYTYMEAGLCRHGTLMYTAQDGTRRRIVHPMTVKERIIAIHDGRRDLADWSESSVYEMWSEHRKSTYQPGRGAWFTAIYSLDTSGSFTVDYLYDEKPAFVPKLSARMYVYDYQNFPRESERTPQWLSAAILAAQTDPDLLI